MWNDYPNLTAQVSELRREATEVYEQIVLPRREAKGYSQTLYGYMHRAFGLIDALSSYWRGDGSNGGQSKRMVDFMETYLGTNRRAHSIAVQIWRHKLVHTALLRNLRDDTTGGIMHYMIQWH